MIVSIHQPEFLPWLPFFDKMDMSDQFVLLDNVQFEKNYFQNRCKIRDGKGGHQLIAIPTKDSPLSTLICEKQIARDQRLIAKMLKSVEFLYSRAPYFKRYFPEIKTHVETHDLVASLNIELIRLCIRVFGIGAKVLVASDLKIAKESDGTRVVGSISKHLQATRYISGRMGRDYLDESYFMQMGIDVAYHDYNFSTYPQSGEKAFIPGLSALDILFNCGEQSLEFIRKGRVHV